MATIETINGKRYRRVRDEDIDFCAICALSSECNGRVKDDPDADVYCSDGFDYHFEAID